MLNIYYWNVHPNFGDLINPWLWPKVFNNMDFKDLPKTEDGILQALDETVLVGIGSLLNERFPVSKKNIVLGAGVGYGAPNNRVREADIYCVRGPLSAQALGIDKSKGIIDPGVLVKKYLNFNKTKKYKVAFMPQVTSMVKCSKAWSQICDELDLELINSMDGVEKVSQEIAEAELLITESMHGAIVAQALDTPWVPIVTRREILDFKWQDWCQSIGLDYQPIYIPPLVENIESIKGKIKNVINYPRTKKMINTAIASKPYLADQAVVDSKIEQLFETFGSFESDYLQTNRRVL